MLLKEEQMLRQEVEYLKSRLGEAKVRSQPLFFPFFMLSKTQDIE